VKVLDASALVELLIGTPRGLRVAEELEDEEESIHMPHLADVEVASALRRLVAAGAISERVAAEAIEDLQDLGMDRHAHDPLLERIWELRRNVSAYDAAYVALAEVLDAPLLTCDRRLKRASGIRAHIQVM